MIATLYPGRHRAPPSTSDVGHCRARAELGCPHAQLRTHTAGLAVSPLVEESLQLRLLLLLLPLPLAAACGCRRASAACMSPRREHCRTNAVAATRSGKPTRCGKPSVFPNAAHLCVLAASTGAIQSSRKGGVMCFCVRSRVAIHVPVVRITA